MTNAVAPVVRHHCRVTQAKYLGGNYFLLTLIPPEPFPFLAGQHVRMFFADADGTIERFYSIANAPHADNRLQFCIVLAEERVTRILRSLKLGDTLEISAAQGKFVLRAADRPVVLVAGGSGISPIRGFFQQLTQNFATPPAQRLHLIYACKSAGFIPGKEEFLDYAALHNRTNLGLWMIAESGTSSGVHQGQLLQYLKEAMLAGADYYLCGPKGMIDAARTALLDAGVAPGQIFQEWP